MLRAAVFAVALVLFVGGVAGVFVVGACAWPAAGWGALLLLALLCERWRYRPAKPPSMDGWDKTDEQFIDPETGAPMQVYYNAATGERRYVRVPQS